MLKRFSLPALALLCLIPGGPTLGIVAALLLGPGGGGADALVAAAYWQVPWPMLLHGGAGLVLVAAIPLQMWPRLRRARPRLHRWLGRAATVAAMGLGLSSFAVLWVYPVVETGLRSAAMAAVGGGMALCFAIGWQTARARRMAAHRVWMIRGVALALSPFVAALLEIPVLALWPQLSALSLTHSRWIGALLCLAVAQGQIGGWRRLPRIGG